MSSRRRGLLFLLMAGRMDEEVERHAGASHSANWYTLELTELFAATGFKGEVVHRLIVVGWLLMSFGMVAGAFFAKQQWGDYWGWDPRQTWSLLTWLLFAAILHARLTAGWRGRRAAYLVLLAVALVLLAIPALDVFTNTRHGGDYL